jgi:hypothetical protein
MSQQKDGLCLKRESSDRKHRPVQTHCDEILKYSGLDFSAQFGMIAEAGSQAPTLPLKPVPDMLKRKIMGFAAWAMLCADRACTPMPKGTEGVPQ